MIPSTELEPIALGLERKGDSVPVKNKDDYARQLAAAHSEWDRGVSKVVRLVSDREGDAEEPIKLLELNMHTVEAGILPVYFGPSDDFPYPSVIVEVTPAEFSKVANGESQLPDGWTVGDTLFERDTG